MLLRPPSYQKPYDNFYLLDPAFEAPPVAPDTGAESEELEAYATARSKHFERMRRARESAMWTEVTVAGKTPTKFVMRPIAGTVARKIADRRLVGMIGHAEMHSLAFRAAIQSIENFDDFKIKQVEHEWLGTIASDEIVNMLDAISIDIVNDLGGDAMERARGPSPK